MKELALLGKLVLVLGLGQLLLQTLLFAAVALRAAYAHESTADAVVFVTTEPLLLGLAQTLGLAIVIALGVRTLAPDEPPRVVLGLAPAVPIPSQALLAAFVAGLALQLPLVELMNVLEELVPAIARDPSRDEAIREATRIDGPLRALSVPLAVVVVPALTEELLFRGLVLDRIRTFFSAPVSVVLVALLFGAFHLEPLAFVYASLAGLVLGAIAMRAGTILPAVAMHAGFNAMPVLLPEAVLPIDGFNTATAAHVAPWLAVASAAVTMVALALTLGALPERQP